MSTTIASTRLDICPAPVEVGQAQLSAYFMELEGLLSRVDSATTHYQVLGVDRADGQEKVKSSFQELFNLLFPPHVIGARIPGEISPRIERAFQKASEAFAVLASFSGKKRYDKALQSAANRPAAPSAPIGSLGNPPDNTRLGGAGRPDSDVASEKDDLIISRMPQGGLAHRESRDAKSGDNRRRCERFKLSIPARVTGHHRRNGKWHEMTQTIDVSRTGARLRLRRRVEHGTVLHVTLPLPTKLRTHGFAEQSHNVYALVRRVEPPKQGVRAVGVEFIGERPPPGFLDKPWAVFRSKRWDGNNRRRENRHEQVEKVTIEYFDESMQLISRDEARTENVSRYGLRISGTTSPAEFDLLTISCGRLKFECLAAVRNRYTAKDGLERICVQLIDKEWPFLG